MAFTGRAVYSDFNAIAEDVADVVSMITPHETPLLDFIGDAPFPARNVLHEWLEDSLSPNTVTTSSAVASTAADTAIGLVSGANRLQAGVILRAQDTGEYFAIASISGNTITAERGFGSTTATSLAAGVVLDVIADAALEGDDVTVDTSGDRARNINYIQLFKKDVIVSGTMEAVTQLGGIDDEFTYQQAGRITEIVRDLEKAVVLGILSGNTIGSTTARRTLDGIRNVISTNVQSVGASLTESWLGNTIKLAWDQGGTDCNLIYAGVNYKRIIDTFTATRVQQNPRDPRFTNLVSEYESTFGLLSVMLGRWMPANELLILATNRINIPPLQGRSFQFREVASQGDSRKGMVVGEYTVELRNEEGMARIT